MQKHSSCIILFFILKEVIFITNYEQKEQEIRDELFDIHLRLTTLSHNEGNPLYDAEIKKVRQELIDTRHKLARLKAEEAGLIDKKKEGR